MRECHFVKKQQLRYIFNNFNNLVLCPSFHLAQ